LRGGTPLFLHFVLCFGAAQMSRSLSYVASFDDRNL